MTAYLLSPPAEEPISLAEAKLYLRQDGTLDDSLIETLISSARMQIEGMAGIAIIAQTWRLLRDDWPSDRVIDLPISPLRSVAAITAYDNDGQPTSIGLAQVQQETATSAPRLILPAALNENPSLREHNGLEIDFIVGIAANAQNVPADLKQSTLALVAHWYENRDAVMMAGAGAVIPKGFGGLISNYQKVRL